MTNADFRAKIISHLSAASLKWNNRKIAINAADKMIAAKISDELANILDEIKSIT